MNGAELAELPGELETARRQVIASALVASLGSLFGLFLTYHLHGWQLGETLRIVTIGYSAIVLALAVTRPPSSRSLLVLFSSLVVPVLLFNVVWTTADPKQFVEPFIGVEMAIMALAMLTPLSLRLGLLFTALATFQGVVLWWLEVGDRLPSEPWITIIYGVFGCGLVIARASERELSRRLWYARSEAVALKRIAELSLDVRDQVNTPLQTIEIALELLRRGGADRRLLAKTQAALDRLCALSRRLSPPA
jgi:hypothetical protein